MLGFIDVYHLCDTRQSQVCRYHLAWSNSFTMTNAAKRQLPSRLEIYDMYKKVAVLLSWLVTSAALQAAPIYSSGPVNGTISASTFGRSFEVSAPFEVLERSVATSVKLGVWAPIGAQALSVQWKIGVELFGETTASGTGSTSGTLIRDFSFGGGTYSLLELTFGLPSLRLDSGKYFLTLSDSSLTEDGYLMWDATSRDYGGAAQTGAGGWYSNIYTPSFVVEGQVLSVPEPHPALLLVTSGLALAAVSRRRRVITS